MKWIPYNRFVIHTNLSKEEIMKRIDEVTSPITPQKVFLYWDYKTPFAGKVFENGFKFRDSGYRDKGYYVRNGFSAINYGEYKNTEIGVDVIVTQKCSVSTFAFLGVMSAFLLFFVSCMFVLGEIKLAFIPLDMFLFSMALLIYGFNKSIKHDTKILTELLK